jgi:predicted DNA-binding ribbon-helix-helix protein
MITSTKAKDQVVIIPAGFNAWKKLSVSVLIKTNKDSSKHVINQASALPVVDVLRMIKRNNAVARIRMSAIKVYP